MKQKTKKTSFSPILVLVIIILGAVGYRAYRNYSTNIISSVKPVVSTSTLTPTPFPAELKDVSLENYLKNKVDACVEYFNENKCDKTKNYAVIQVINKNYAYGGFGNSQTGFQFAAVKINGSWTDFWTGGGGIPGCSELVNFPPGIFGEEILNSCSDGNKLIMRTTGKILFPTN